MSNICNKISGIYAPGWNLSISGHFGQQLFMSKSTAKQANIHLGWIWSTHTFSDFPHPIFCLQIDLPGLQQYFLFFVQRYPEASICSRSSSFPSSIEILAPSPSILIQMKSAWNQLVASLSLHLLQVSWQSYLTSMHLVYKIHSLFYWNIAVQRGIRL